MASVTRQAWRTVAAAVLAANVAAAVTGRTTICTTIRHDLHFEDPRGRAAAVALIVGGVTWWLPHLLDPAKRPTTMA